MFQLTTNKQNGLNEVREYGDNDAADDISTSKSPSMDTQRLGVT